MAPFLRDVMPRVQMVFERGTFYNTIYIQARSQPARWGGGSELGWVEHYIQGMVGLSISWQKQGV